MVWVRDTKEATDERDGLCVQKDVLGKQQEEVGRRQM